MNTKKNLFWGIIGGIVGGVIEDVIATILMLGSQFFNIMLFAEVFFVSLIYFIAIPSVILGVIAAWAGDKFYPDTHHFFRGIIGGVVAGIFGSVVFLFVWFLP